MQIPLENGVVPSFAETKFEASPLSRIEQQGATGAPWQLSAGHTKRVEYSQNNSTIFNSGNNQDQF